MFSRSFYLGRSERLYTQRGAVLFIGLIFLFLMSLIAVTISRTSILQERMTGGLRNDQLATMGADSALREAEQRLWRAPVDRAFLACNPTASLGCYSFTSGALPIQDVANFRNPAMKSEDIPTNVGFSYNTAALDLPAVGLITSRLDSPPRYIIEDMGIDGTTGAHQNFLRGVISAPTRKQLYRITARSSGGNINTQRVLESTFSALKSR